MGGWVGWVDEFAYLLIEASFEDSIEATSGSKSPHHSGKRDDEERFEEVVDDD